MENNWRSGKGYYPLLHIYAKNEEGKVYNRFGMLNQKGGENRLNVAVTRAKEGIIVVSSIEPEELNS
ncbi:hypothetical protein [Neobacillus bataviensis]|uniref:hypothetical protein n=1 Tax=Neobacillus bataviensis TaxID=220685 RepID=UPI001CBBECD8|nr:hypothetical protein [Neobacillus bataviensis]